MCNVCNMGISNRCGGGYTPYQSREGVSCGCSCGCFQRVCRDACGNLYVCNVNQCNMCGCSTGNGPATGNNGGNGTNTNGVFRCVTFCGYGNGNGAASNRSGYNCASTYYARQYGLSCDDSGECSYNFTDD